jgi:hypothetical protein
MKQAWLNDREKNIMNIKASSVVMERKEKKWIG